MDMDKTSLAFVGSDTQGYRFEGVALKAQGNLVDFEGDGSSDIGVYRTGASSIRRSLDNGNTMVGWGGAPQDRAVQRDYDGDGKTDIAIYRDGAWSIRRSSDFGNTIVGWGGAPQDIPLN
jgi:hypothetical protein